MLKIEIRNPKSEIERLAAIAWIILAAAAAHAAPERLGTVFGPALRVEYTPPAGHFKGTEKIFWYPRVAGRMTPWGDNAKAWEAWVKEFNTFAEWRGVERQAGGLVMKIREDAMPEVQPPGGTWFTMFRPVHGQGHPETVAPSPVCFGSIRPVPMLPGEHFFAGERPTWGANKLTFSYTRPVSGGDEEEAGFSVVVSRLTPALLAESDAESVIFFSDAPRTPRHIAWSANGKIKTHTFEEGEILAAHERSWQDAVKKDIMQDLLDDSFTPVELDSPEWILAWFGEQGSFFYASRDARWLYDFHRRASTGEGHPVGIESWYGDMTAPADMPMLLVFEHPPMSATLAEGGGIRFDFDGQAGNIAMMPLFGEDPPAAGEIKDWHAGLTENTRSWAGRLPEAIREKCDWWEKRLRQFPVNVRENAKYDAATDELTLAYSFEYELVGEGGVKFAPVPPMLALAAKMGFPAVLPEHVDSGYRTQLGPYIGVDNADGYEIKINGLGKYAREARVPAGRELPEAAGPIRTKLVREVEKILSTGRLAPGFYHSANITSYQLRRGPSFVWDRPGEIVTCLAQAMNFLPKELQTQVVAYMKDEQAARPAEKTIALPARDGERREPFRLDTRTPKWDSMFTQRSDYIDDILDFSAYLALHNDRYLKDGLVPPDALYALAEYKRCAQNAEIDWPATRRAMDAHDARRDWAGLGFMKRTPSRISNFTQGGGRDAAAIETANAYLAGCIGLVRLAGLFDDKPFIDEAYARFCLAAAHRFALETYVQWLYKEKLLRLPDKTLPDWLAKLFTGDWTGWPNYVLEYTPETDSRQIKQIDEMSVILSLGGGMEPTAGAAVPEAGRFLNDFLGEALRAREQAAFEPADWFVWNCGAYSAKKPLGNARFLLHSWILNANADDLASWLGAPWAKVGDLYYIQRLVEALAAYNGAEWR